MPCPPPGDLPNPGVKSGSPTLLADSLPSEPPGKPKNTGVSNLTLLQGVFLTHKSNWDLLHCRWILYQLSYQGRPRAIMLLLLLLSHFSRVRLCATPWTAADQASLSFTMSPSLLKLMFLESVMPSNHLILSPLSPPALNLSQHQEPVSQLFASGGQSIGHLQLQHQSFQ